MEPCSWGRTIAATGATGLSSSHHFHVHDTHPHTHFLFDTGSALSFGLSTPPGQTLTYGITILQLLRTGNDCSPSTSVSSGHCPGFADVQQPILSADFLRHFGLLVDMKQRELINSTTHFHVHGNLSTDSCPHPSFCPKHTNDPYHSLLSEFPALTHVRSPDSPILYDVTHHIEITGLPVSARPRRLAPERLRVAKQEFEHMLQLGIIHPSSSAWSSPPHAGDRPLNRATMPDRYPIPHIHDSSSLEGTTIYSKLDHAYHQIPVDPADVPNSAVRTSFCLFEFVGMPFGLRNAARTFQQFMAQVLRDVPLPTTTSSSLATLLNSTLKTLFSAALPSMALS